MRILIPTSAFSCYQIGPNAPLRRPRRPRTREKEETMAPPRYNHTREDSPATPCPECAGRSSERVEFVDVVGSYGAPQHAASPLSPGTSLENQLEYVIEKLRAVEADNNDLQKWMHDAIDATKKARRVLAPLPCPLRCYCSCEDCKRVREALALLKGLLP